MGSQPLVLAAATLRCLAIGFLGVTLGVHFASLGYGAGHIGLLVGVGLAGNALGTAVVAALGNRLSGRSMLVAVSFLSAVGLAALAASTGLSALLVASFFGMVNGMGRDRGAAQTLEQAILADLGVGPGRTRAFVRYALLQDVGGALGSAAAGAPVLLERWWPLSPEAASRWMLGACALAMLVQVGLHGALRVPGQAAAARSGRVRAAVAATTKRRVAGLSGLFALDSLGGGFLAGAIIAYWFFRRFGLSPATIGAVFFAARLLNAASYFGAEALARRIGLVRTMVYTHLPSSAVLMALPFAAAPWLAIGLFLVRESLVQMDVPARQSYVAAIVAPHERTFALGATNVTRYVGWAAGPGLAGLAIGAFGLGAPLVIGAGLKVVYDVALFASFASVHPPEEVRSGPAGASEA